MRLNVSIKDKTKTIAYLLRKGNNYDCKNKSLLYECYKNEWKWIQKKVHRTNVNYRENKQMELIK